MSRHRDVRNMDYTEDYDGYDDVYGHSMDDDYYISPSHRQFIFNRDNSRDQPKIGEFMSTEHDIKEEDESDMAIDLSDIEKAKLESCIEQIKSTLSPLNLPRNELVNIIISHNFDVEQATNEILNNGKHFQSEKKDVTTNNSKFFVPKLNGLATTSVSVLDKNQFNIPSLSKLSSEKSAPKTFTIPKIGSFSKEQDDCGAKFNNLSALVSNHLSKSFKNHVTVCNSDNPVSQIAHKLNDLQITRSEPETNTPTTYQIDLSIALKPSLSSQSVLNKGRHCTREEKFEIPFVDCDVDSESKTVLKSTLDVKHILHKCVKNAKPVSRFGKVLCRNYRKLSGFKVKHTNLMTIKRFNFETPSSDDTISKHLKAAK